MDENNSLDDNKKAKRRKIFSELEIISQIRGCDKKKSMGK